MTMTHLRKKGDVVNVFQWSHNEGLLFEGKATVLKPPGTMGEEFYKVRFHGPDGKPSLGEEYMRFVDKDGQGDPDAYVREFNLKIGHKED